MGPWRWVILPAAGAVATWTGAALLVWGVVPLLTAEPANASSAAEIAIGTYALATTGALGGSVVVAGLGLTWSKPRWVFGRVLLLIGGVVAALAGLLTTNLLVLVLAHYYHFNPAGFSVWWAAMGALFGALGYGLTFLAPTNWLAGTPVARVPQPTQRSVA